MKLGRYLLNFVFVTLFALPLRIAQAGMAQGGDDVIWLDPQRTNIDFVLLGNLHDTHGRFTLRRGTIAINPHNGNATGELIIDATSEDSGEGLRDAIMKNGILDVRHYPEIAFIPQRVEGTRGSGDDFCAASKQASFINRFASLRRRNYSLGCNMESDWMKSYLGVPHAREDRSLYARHVNPQWTRLLDVLQMDVDYDQCLGAELHTTDGCRILDFNSGYCVHNAGHDHPAIKQAIKEEIDRDGPAMLQSHVSGLAGELVSLVIWRRGCANVLADG